MDIGKQVGRVTTTESQKLKKYIVLEDCSEETLSAFSYSRIIVEPMKT